MADRRGVERDVIGIAVHERDLLGVHADLRLVAGHQDAAAAGAGGPVQHLVALEVAAGADQRQAAAQLVRLGRSRNGCTGPGRITQGRSASCRWIGAPPKARLHSTIAV